jgi:hypothetical protein
MKIRIKWKGSEICYSVKSIHIFLFTVDYFYHEIKNPHKKKNNRNSFSSFFLA